MGKYLDSYSLLENEFKVWGKNAPLQPPPWFEDQVLLFSDAVEKASYGKKTESIQILQKIRSDEMRTWFESLGQHAGMYRVAKLSTQSSAKLSADQLDTLRAPAKFEKAVFERDSYLCRYCGLKVVAKKVLTAFEKAVGKSNFSSQGTSAQQHGILHGFKIVADHVVPHRLGGRTDLNNLVTSCPACNYGKYYYTIEQLGIDDPRDRPPVKSDWDGLTSFIEGLKQYQLSDI